MNVFEGFPDVSMKDIIVNTDSGIALAPSSLDLVGVEPYLYSIDDRTKVLREALKSITQKYDHVLIDTPPSMGQFVLNGLVAADRTIVTLDSGFFALKGVDALNIIFDDIRENIGRNVSADLAIITKTGIYDEKKRSFFDGILASLKSLLNKDSDEIKERERILGNEEEVRKLFTQVFTIPYDVQIYEAQQHGMPISHYAPAGRAARAYSEIADIVKKW